MATWQFDIALIPTVALDADPQIIEKSISEDGLDTGAWWVNADLPADLDPLLDSVLPMGESWSDELELRGTEDSDRIDVWRAAGRVDSILVRVDVREPGSEFLERVCEFAERLGCKLYLFEANQILEPNFFTLRRAIQESSAAKFVSDPEAFLIEIAHAEKP